jgi:hypothetical protein
MNNSNTSTNNNNNDSSKNSNKSRRFYDPISTKIDEYFTPCTSQNRAVDVGWADLPYKFLYVVK